jgi:hypothetical protein
MTATKLKGDITLAHELDAAWIIGLWKAIHGGDPSPEQVAIQAIAALSTRLAAPSEHITTPQMLQAGLKQLGVIFKHDPNGRPDVRDCVTLPGGRVICT